ncbi:MAG: septum formation initiator family protein [Clostridia bacterium]|nr:septum formation initiator family protein [Clostridia bacterium]
MKDFMSRAVKKRSIILRLLVIFVSVFMITKLVGLLNDLNSKKSELNALNEELKTKQADVEELKNLIDNGSKEQIIEKAARQRLGFVYSNEEIYVDISGN